ncbi:MAG: hypothetical protein OSJ44_09230 [Lachnospiraceae bacterium]|nr:hypothetical protein [Lachnospiraceae bacterium]
MKHAVYGVVLGFILILFVFIGATVQGRAVRSDEAETSLGEAIESTAAALFASDENYTIYDNEKFVADFLKELSLQLGSDSVLTVDVLKADYELGMLSIKVTEEYDHPNGKRGTAEAYKTVIYDNKSIEDAKIANVCFYRTKEEMEGGGEPFKTSQALSGDTVFAPEGPEHPYDKEHMRFFKWLGKDGAEFPGTGMEFEVTEGTKEDFVFYGEYEKAAGVEGSTENGE